jgi:hypothetical protein
MSARGLLCLAVVIFIFLAVLCLVPTGHGPRPAVYGPATALRAYQASVLLKFAIASAITVLTACVRVSLSRFGHLEPASELGAASTCSLPSISAALRC